MNYNYIKHRKRKGDRLPLILGGILLAAVLTAILFLIIKGPAKEPEVPAEDTNQTEAPEEKDTFETRGVFVPTVYNLSFPSKTDLTAEQLKAELETIVENTKKAGLNTIYFQVRPSCDALYKSEIFPVSETLSTTGELPLDCLEYLSEICRAQNVKLHAWVNPLRVTAYDRDISELPENSPAKKLENGVVSYGEKLYLDPGDPEARDLICRGIKEICENYDIDGVIFDDYFYPYPEYEKDENGVEYALTFEDTQTFEAHGKDYESIGNFRRDNINKLVKSAYETVKAVNPECEFGVSCFGIWKNTNGANGGSVTTGSESYYETFCDTLSWIKGEYVDYVAPQLYWDCNSLAANFTVLSKWWNQQVENTNVKLLIAHAAYRYDGSFEAGSKEMTKQLENAESLSEYTGSIFYSYNALRDNLDGITEELSNYYITKDSTPEK